MLRKIKRTREKPRFSVLSANALNLLASANLTNHAAQEIVRVADRMCDGDDSEVTSRARQEQIGRSLFWRPERK